MALSKSGQLHRIGIFGGTFDPVHTGHLIVAQEIVLRFPLDKVVFMPAGRPPHKDPVGVSPASNRLEMLRLAVKDNDCFEVSDLETTRTGTTYTVDTMRELRSLYGSDVEIYYIIGADTVPELVKWKDFEELLRETRFIAARRPGIGQIPVMEEADRLEREYGAKIRFIDTPEIDISSTEIRRRVAAGKTVRYLVPNAVRTYINEFDLYRSMV